jgi:hypothetical protein
MDNTQENIGKRETQLRHWGARLDEIAAKAEKVGIEVNAAKRQRVDEARTKCQAAQSKLDEYKAAGAEKWETFKTGLETAWSDLESAFKKLKD